MSDTDPSKKSGSNGVKYVLCDVGFGLNAFMGTVGPCRRYSLY